LSGKAGPAYLPGIPNRTAPMHDDPTLRRTIILGNSGSGKSWLAARLAARLGVPALDLDTIHWIGPGYGTAREPDEARAMVTAAAEAAHWVIEGVYGWLADAALPRATCLVWLRPPVAECLDNLRHRGQQPGGDQAGFAALLDWAGAYDRRGTSSSQAGHAERFDHFPARKVTLRSRREMDGFLAEGAPRGRAGD
jgi:hypothetical protein